MAIIQNMNPELTEELYLRWQESPHSVPDDWSAFFSGYELGISFPGEGDAAKTDSKNALRQSAVQSLIYRYRDIGHLLACTDPLSPCKSSHPLLELKAFGLSDEDLSASFTTRRFMNNDATLREILEVMRETYCRSIGVEFMHIQEPGERQWLIDRMEPVRNRPALSSQEKLSILGKLQETVMFESFLNRKFPGQTRFSLEGGEVLTVLLAEALFHAAGQGVHDAIIGMPHRGRLNVLANVLAFPLELMFAQFRDCQEGMIGDGDVKYHAGHSSELVLSEGSRIHVTMAANPSHLEAIDPVVEGKVRATQDLCGHAGRQCVLAILVHGDAAFAGQGVVAETLNLSQLPGYKTGGTLHIVLNNQIGFTTPPDDARSSSYATDVAKMIMAPVFHVHGEDPEAAVHVIRLALDYRRQFGRDVVVEIVCYRRYGHNEGDEPVYTQPIMYGRIKGRPDPFRIYSENLIAEGMPLDTVKEKEASYAARLHEAAAGRCLTSPAAFTGVWESVAPEFTFTPIDSSVKRASLLSYAATLAHLPEEFSPHPKIVSILQKRHDAVVTGEGIDWGTAEALAWASLLQEGVSVRLSGQDSRRGTFSQRHALIFDMNSGVSCMPLAGLQTETGKVWMYDSLLSEFAVLGFEYGYSLATPRCLTMWEAQYGDFANGAQVVIDQFISSGETKWQRASGLVLLLPHGYEGQGAEHSSARIERFLQLCAGNNLQVVYPTTPAQYFHLLRRQMRQPFRKPLVVFTPKSLLRSPKCSSLLDDFVQGHFREVLPADEYSEVTRLLLCTGKIYFDLLERKEREKRGDVAIIRIEQLYPLRMEMIQEAVAPFSGVTDIRWVQEEPANNGAWSFLRTPLQHILGKEPDFIGRGEDAAPAVGSLKLHRGEQEQVVADAFK